MIVNVNLNETVIEKLSDIAKDLGNITLGSVIIPYILNRGDLIVSISGIIIALLLYFASIWLIYNINE